MLTLHALWIRDRKTCWICGLPVTLDVATKDHVIPKSKGGTEADANMRLAHEKCNRDRGNEDPDLSKLPRRARRALKKRMRVLHG